MEDQIAHAGAVEEQNSWVWPQTHNTNKECQSEPPAAQGLHITASRRTADSPNSPQGREREPPQSAPGCGCPGPTRHRPASRKRQARRVCRLTPAKRDATRGSARLLSERRTPTAEQAERVTACGSPLEWGASSPTRASHHVKVAPRWASVGAAHQPSVTPPGTRPPDSRQLSRQQQKEERRTRRRSDG